MAPGGDHLVQGVGQGRAGPGGDELLHAGSQGLLYGSSARGLLVNAGVLLGLPWREARI